MKTDVVMTPQGVEVVVSLKSTPLKDQIEFTERFNPDQWFGGARSLPEVELGPEKEGENQLDEQTTPANNKPSWH